MDTQKLDDIIQKATKIYQIKGEPVRITQIGVVGVIELSDYPSIEDAPSGKNFDKVGMVICDVVVNKTEAKQYRGALVEELRNYQDQKRLAQANYVDLATIIEMDQEKALRLMALGKSLEIWDIGSARNDADDATKINLAVAGGIYISNINYKLPE